MLHKNIIVTDDGIISYYPIPISVQHMPVLYLLRLTSSSREVPLIVASDQVKIPLVLTKLDETLTGRRAVKSAYQRLSDVPVTKHYPNVC